MSRLSRLGFIDTHRTQQPVRRRVRSRGVPPALEEHEVFYTEDPHEASRLVGQALAPNQLTVGNVDTVATSDFAASMHGIRFRDISLLYLDLHVPVELDIAHSGAYYAVHAPMNGRAVGTVNSHPFEANPIQSLVTNPSDPLRMRMDHDSPQLIVRIEQDALERYLTRLTGRTPTQMLVFEPTINLTLDAAMRWNGAIQLLHSEVFYPGSLVHQGLGIGPLEDFVMSALLIMQPSNYSLMLRRAPGRPGRRVVRRSMDFIEHHLSEQITMSDIATSVGASTRSVQLGFREELGTTPMAYLRDRRLERVREELTDADPADGVTVSSVASRWGFNHLGSFAGMYRRRWGESPSQTLHS